MHDQRLIPSVNAVIQKNSFLEKHVHLIVIAISTLSRPLENVQIKHLSEVAHVDLVSLNRLGSLLF